MRSTSRNKPQEQLACVYRYKQIHTRERVNMNTNIQRYTHPDFPGLLATGIFRSHSSCNVASDLFGLQDSNYHHTWSLGARRQVTSSSSFVPLLRKPLVTQLRSSPQNRGAYFYISFKNLRAYTRGPYEVPCILGSRGPLGSLLRLAYWEGEASLRLPRSGTYLDESLLPAKSLVSYIPLRCLPGPPFT